MWEVLKPYLITVIEITEGHFKISMKFLAKSERVFSVLNPAKSAFLGVWIYFENLLSHEVEFAICIDQKYIFA